MCQAIQDTLMCNLTAGIKIVWNSFDLAATKENFTKTNKNINCTVDNTLDTITIRQKYL